jgi:hypothetical protein
VTEGSVKLRDGARVTSAAVEPEAGG